MDSVVVRIRVHRTRSARAWIEFLALLVFLGLPKSAALLALRFLPIQSILFVEVA